MVLLQKPTTQVVQSFLTAESKQELTYAPVGGTFSSTPPTGHHYKRDHERIKLGDGQVVFEKAQAALRRWEQFRLGWVETFPQSAAIAEGQVVAILARAAGLWWLGACRIIAVVDEELPVKRFGFAYGTLPGHMESGEERFLIEWDRQEGSVWYDILAFSRPRHILAQLGYPWARRVQERFRRDSATAMRSAIATAAQEL